LQLNGGNVTSISANGGFRFAATLQNGATYTISVSSQPSNPGQTCSAQSATGTIAGADVTNIAVTCVTNPVRFAYVVNKDSNDVSAYTMDTVTGALTAVSGSPFAAGTGPISITLTPSDQFAYVTNATSYDISEYSISPTSGALVPVNGSPIAVTPAEPWKEIIPPLVIDPSGRLALVANPRAPIMNTPGREQPGNLLAFQIDSTTGTLTPTGGSVYWTGGIYPQSLKMDSMGRFVYVVNSWFQGSDFGNVAAFAVDANAGTLTPVSGTPVNGGRLPEMFFLDPLNRFGYSNYLNPGQLSTYRLNATSGALTKTGQILIGELKREPVFDPSGKVLYLPPNSGNALSAYAVDQTTGALTFLSATSFTLPSGTCTPVMHPSGKYLYVSCAVHNSVYAFSIDSATGALTSITGSPYSLGAGSSPLWAVLDPSAQFLYTSNGQSSDITTFQIDGNTGALTLLGNSPVATGANPGPLAFTRRMH
jgi:6-phosphogluconolactonase (cycloisomerase 2 family)